jgi:hypothetical protein
MMARWGPTGITITTSGWWRRKMAILPALMAMPGLISTKKMRMAATSRLPVALMCCLNYPMGLTRFAIVMVCFIGITAQVSSQVSPIAIITH